MNSAKGVTKGNISVVYGKCSDGRVQNDPDAMKMWGREYEKGWEPRV